MCIIDKDRGHYYYIAMFIQIFTSICGMFIPVFTGTFVRHIGIIDKNFTRNLSNFLVLVAFPALIFYSMITQFSKEMLLNAVILVIFGIFVCFLGYIIGLILSRYLKSRDVERNTFLILSAFGNTFLLSVPIGVALYGTEAVIQIVLFDLGCTIAMWTLGIWVISSHRNNLEINLAKNLLNPGIIAVIVGLGVVMTELKLPNIFTEACRLIGSSTIPMALITMGSLLYRAEFYRQIRWRTLITLSLGKLILMPSLVILILFLTPIPLVISKIIVLEAAMPSMVFSTILAEKYESDSSLAASGVSLTTLLSIITVPIFLSLIPRWV